MVLEVKPPVPSPLFSPPPMVDDGGRSANEQMKVVNALAFPADYCELWTVVLEVKPPAPPFPPSPPPPVAEEGGRSANEQRRVANASAFPADYCELWTELLEVKPPAPSFPFSVVLASSPARAKDG